MNRFNTELPRIELPEPPRTNWFSKYHLWGYAFLGLTFLLIIAFIYQMEYNKKPQESRICIQVVTTARSPYSGETKEFPTPCDVPEGWEVVPGVYNEIPNLDISKDENNYKNSALGYSVKFDESEYKVREDGPSLVYISPKEYFETPALQIGVSDLSPDAYIAEVASGVDDFMRDGIEYKTLEFAGQEWREISYGIAIGGGMRDLITVRDNKTFYIKSFMHEDFDEIINSIRFF